MALNHSPKIITNGLVFYLDSANTKSYLGSGTSISDFVGNRTGTILNGALFLGSNFQFDGADDYLTYSNAISIAPTFTGTVEFIARGTGPIISNERTGSSHGFGGVSITAGGALEIWSVTTYSSPYGYGLSTTNTQPTNKFNYYAVSATIPNGGTFSASLMINGLIENKSQSILGGAPAAYFGLDVGRTRNWIYGTTMFNGAISMVRIYNRVLTDSEMMMNYNLFRGRLGT